MSAELATKNTALATLDEESKALLQEDRAKMGSQYPTIPQIRMVNKDMKQAPEGEYFIERKNGDQVDVTPIGKNPEITILYRTSSYSYFTKEDGLIAWTSDIHGFTDLDDVTLYKRQGDKVVIDFEGGYQAFKSHIAKNYTMEDKVTGKTKKLLKFKTVLYVLYKDDVYKMFVSNASSAGVDLQGNPSFENPKPGSLQVLTDSYWKQKRVSYEFLVQLGSAYVESSKPFYLMTFTNLSELDAGGLKQAIRKSRDTQKAIFMLDEARKKANAKGQEENAEPVVADIKPEIDPEDLPF